MALIASNGDPDLSDGRSLLALAPALLGGAWLMLVLVLVLLLLLVTLLRLEGRRRSIDKVGVKGVDGEL